MGYSFGWNTRKELIEYLTKEWESPSEKTVTIAHSSSGSVLWTVNERTQKGTGEKTRWIGCCLIKGSGGLNSDCDAMRLHVWSTGTTPSHIRGQFYNPPARLQSQGTGAGRTGQRTPRRFEQARRYQIRRRGHVARGYGH